MQVPAVLIGRRVPRPPWAGVVHSVFRRACNIVLEDGRLLSVLDATRGAVPHGISLATEPGFDLRHWVKPHARVTGHGDVICFERTSVVIDLCCAEMGCTSIGHIASDMENSSTRAAWRAAWSKVADAAQPNGFGAFLSSCGCSALTDRLLQVSSARISELMRSTRALDRSAAISAATGAIGMGPGLTPSWDDFLVGYISGLRTTTLGRPERSQFVAALGNAVRAAATATTFASRAQLDHAADGDVSERLVAMLAAMAGGDVGGTAKATAKLLELGSTSGTDTAIGALCGLAAWPSKHANVLPVEALLSSAFDNCGPVQGGSEARRSLRGSDPHACC
jgi:hypothetical protein